MDKGSSSVDPVRLQGAEWLANKPSRAIGPWVDGEESLLNKYRIETVPVDSEISFHIYEIGIEYPIILTELPAVEDVMLSFTLNGRAITKMQDRRNAHIDNGGEIALIAPHDSVMRDVTFDSVGCHRFVQVTMPHSRFLSLSSDMGFSLTKQQSRRLGGGRARIVKKTRMTPHIEVAVQQIFRMPVNSSARTAYIRAKAAEMLTLYLGAQAPADEKSKTSKLQPAVEYRVERARAILVADLCNAPSISELAAIVRLGESTLRRGFRIRYGKSIYKFLTDSRLDAARSMIADQPWRSINDVAYDVGLRCPGRFSSMFLNRFGVLPSLYRRSCSS